MTYGNLIYNPNATFPSSGGVNLITEPNATMVTTGTVPYPRCISRDLWLQYYDVTSNGSWNFPVVPNGYDLYVQKLLCTLISSNSGDFVNITGPGGIWLTGPQGFSFVDYVAAPMVVSQGTQFTGYTNNLSSSISYLMVILSGILAPHDSGLWS